MEWAREGKRLRYLCMDSEVAPKSEPVLILKYYQKALKKKFYLKKGILNPLVISP